MIECEGGCRAAAPKGSMTYAFTHMGNFLLLLPLLHRLLILSSIGNSHKVAVSSLPNPAQIPPTSTISNKEITMVGGAVAPALRLSRPKIQWSALSPANKEEEEEHSGQFADGREIARSCKDQEREIWVRIWDLMKLDMN